MTFSVDGADYDTLVVGIKRKAEIRASDVAGLLLDKTYFNDVLGTYMTYDVQIAIPAGQENTYAGLYEILSDPVESHVFELPYNQSTITLTARVETISDEYFRKVNGTILWRKTTFSIIANEPSKVPS